MQRASAPLEDHQLEPLQTCRACVALPTLMRGTPLALATSEPPEDVRTVAPGLLKALKKARSQSRKAPHLCSPQVRRDRAIPQGSTMLS